MREVKVYKYNVKEYESETVIYRRGDFVAGKNTWDEAVELVKLLAEADRAGFDDARSIYKY